MLAVAGDVAEGDHHDRIIGGALERFGRIDTLVNDAGIYTTKPFTDYTEDDYETMVGVDLTGFFRLTQRTVVQMLKGGGGPHRRHHVDAGRLCRPKRTIGADVAHQGRHCRRHEVAGR